MTTIDPLKSILKKSSTSATASRVDRSREIAVYHANIIQQRKNFELEILFSTETLIDYPHASSPYDASKPSPVDSENFKRIIQHFQPSDYDALILERNINQRCGYTLCPNTRKKECMGKYRLIGTGGKAKDFRIVENKDQDKWCSDSCAKRALFIRIQLSEIPVWERLATGKILHIDLLSEPIVQDIDNLGANLNSGPNKGFLESSCLPSKTEVGVNLLGSTFSNIIVSENKNTGPALAPSLNDNNNSHLELEGYTTENNDRLLLRHQGR